MKTRTIIKRYCIFLIGLIFCALGISFVTRAGLGTSPVSGLPFVISLITGISMGTFTFLFNMLFLILEAILRRKFTLQQALQIPITFAFSFFIDRFMAMIPTRFGGPWGSSFVYLMIGCVVMALGISLEVMADVIMLPAEALIIKERALNDRRSYGIRVTDDGKEEVDRMYYYYLDPLYTLREQMTSDDFEKLFRLIEEANTILNNANSK